MIKKSHITPEKVREFVMSGYWDLPTLAYAVTLLETALRKFAADAVEPIEVRK